MPAVDRIAPALLLLCCPLLVAAQTAAPMTAPATPHSGKQGGQNVQPSTLPQPGAPEMAQPAYIDPCVTNVAELDADTCYADLVRVESAELNHVYRAAILVFEKDLEQARRRSDDDQLTFDSTAILDLKAAETAWAKYRDIQCDAAGQQLQGGSIEPIVISKCLALVTRHRIDEIRAAYEIGGRTLE